MKLTAKIVQGERNSKKQLAVFLALPSRRLSYGKIVQGERNSKNVFAVFYNCRAAAILS